MRALVCTTPGVAGAAPGGGMATEVTTVPDPTPVAGQVVVAVDTCGICGSDVHAVENGLAEDGQILGHEFSGRVVETVGDVGTLKVDQRVAVNPVGECGVCGACRRGVPFRCETLPNVGVSRSGAFAELIAVPHTQVVPVSDERPLATYAGAEPLAVAMAAVDLGRVGAGATALVYGVGSIGLNCILALQEAGVREIHAVGRAEGRRRAAARLGATSVVDARETSAADAAREQGVEYDVVLECSGAAGVTEECLEVLAPGGTLVEVAVTPHSLTVPIMALVGGGTTIVGSCAFDAATYDRAVAAIERGLGVDELVSATVPLDDAPAALVQMRSPGAAVRTVVAI